MSEPIFEQAYWKERLAKASAGEEHMAVFRCPLAKWQAIEAKHREILKERIAPTDSILDAGCGWGRLLSLFPEGWRGQYLGLDLSLDFIKKAQERYPYHCFEQCDLRSIPNIIGRFDWAIMVSMKHMIIRNAGIEAWTQVEQSVKQHARAILFLEYDEMDCGSIG